MHRVYFRRFLFVTASLTALGGAASAHAADAGSQAGQPADAVRQGEARQTTDIIVTATKRAGGELVQDVPVAITAFDADALEQKQFQTLQDLNFAAPNTQIAPHGLVSGKITVSIRGYGVANAIPSLEQTVGLFVDGIYNPMSLGALSDNFDLEAVEILRGPQGVLFGKNVSGGAIVMRTTTPGNELRIDAKAQVETGLNYTGSLSVSGPIVEDLLSVKLAGYYNYDEGWFDNAVPDAPTLHGSERIFRAAARFTPGDLDIVAKYEHGDTDLDGDPPYQNSLIVPQGTFHVESDGAGLTFQNWDQLAIEANWDVGFGDGTITNIAGWRWLEFRNSSNVDGRREFFFRSATSLKQRQFSNELRYAGTFGDFELTTGLYYFSQFFSYTSDRDTGDGTAYTRNAIGGGTQKQDSYGAFIATDWHLTDQVTLNLGLRYTHDDKEFDLATQTPDKCIPDSIWTQLECNFDYVDVPYSTSAFIPKIGVQWEPDSDTQLYAFWTKGLRSGGHSVRLAAGFPPVPFEDEITYALEGGIKTDLDDGRVRVNVSVFRNVTKDGQRESLFNTDGPAGNISIIRNIADYTIQGVELETVVRPARGLTLSGFVGLMESHYDNVQADLNRDGVIDETDKRIEIPLVPPFSWSASATYESDIGTHLVGLVSASYGYKDRQGYNDTGVGFLNAHETFDAHASLTYDDRTTLSVYAKNLFNHWNNNAFTALGASAGGPGATIFSPSKGRVLGASIRYKM